MVLVLWLWTVRALCRLSLVVVYLLVHRALYRQGRGSLLSCVARKLSRTKLDSFKSVYKVLSPCWHLIC